MTIKIIITLDHQSDGMEIKYKSDSIGEVCSHEEFFAVLIRRSVEAAADIATKGKFEKESINVH